MIPFKKKETKETLMKAKYFNYQYKFILLP